MNPRRRGAAPAGGAVRPLPLEAVGARVRGWGRVVGPPLVLAHRGASAEAPENTLRAFRRARERGADGVELDVRRCASGEVVVFHDADLRRLGGGRPEAIAALPLAALREVDLGGGERIPTLDETLEELGPTQLVNVELKVETLRSTGLEAAAVEVVRRAGARRRALLSSFHPLALARVRARAPELMTGLLFHRDQALPWRRAWPAALVRPFALHPDAGLVDDQAVRRWRSAGYVLHVWTVDDPRELRALAALGVDGIITNDPGRARVALGLEPARSAPAATPR